jgi:hypothetical protein
LGGFEQREQSVQGIPIGEPAHWSRNAVPWR